jgi:xylulokinase
MRNEQFLLGYDLGSSSVKVSILSAETGRVAATASSPAVEMEISSPQSGWAEQHPDLWWSNAVKATKQAMSNSGVNAEQIQAIGISYQMHGLVVVDQRMEVLRPAIIWCDSRAVQIGNKAYESLGATYCDQQLLNSPGNFTASKLRWIQQNEPHVYQRIYKFMLPGDYLAMRMTKEITTTVSGLSEGIFWDYKNDELADSLLSHYQIDRSLLPEVMPTFGVQGALTAEAAGQLGLRTGIDICYRAGDQPNNAFSLKTLHPGEVAATAGTSGVIYGIMDQPKGDAKSRVNVFAHVNHERKSPRLGVLLCVNGTGIMNSWLRKNLSAGGPISYAQLNEWAQQAPIGSDGLRVLPFGNGAERMLENRSVGASLHQLDLNRHGISHLSRAVQEGIVFSLGYGFEILGTMGIDARVIRAGRANMFLSDTFCEAFCNTTGARLELYNTDGAQGAARGAGVGKKLYQTMDEAFSGLACIETFNPDTKKHTAYRSAYDEWKNHLNKQLKV